MAVILATRFYFQPIFRYYDLHQSLFFKSMTQTLINDTGNKRIHYRHVCFSHTYFWDKDERPYQMELTTMPSLISKEFQAVIKFNNTHIEENHLMAIDNRTNNITDSFINELIKRSAKFDHSFSTSHEALYEFYTTACIPVRYMKYCNHYYVYPTTPISHTHQ
ncbi:hypothetical protein LP123_06445 [Moraxella bovis]|uniref:Uncharacterized protein n=1 Tax=Moraxella bovis TaxID=476 RepID=A0AAQ2Q5Y3_MORBO|nr:hypothetical protein [Moraxella bovis]AWY20163.1 hypothetical protein DQF64_06425 [Moraxella bovis]OOR90600.1 hypothetical protein B0182_04860 [Moraxella bovis]UYZ74696.1 hypothetical protein LP093_07890 [Moraxella bovis]UYZ79381.1 hypothetical protein LP115_06020 [Moraxella bovis]UYZ80026.1 hypothetical protein LP113_08160 [Moraxella bovis]